jgi:hypothetical protein
MWLRLRRLQIYCSSYRWITKNVFKKLLYSRVGAGAASKIFPEARAVTKCCGSARLNYYNEKKISRSFEK